MSENHVPYLCGGTFFYLLINARWTKSTPRERRGGIKDGLRDCDLMNALLSVINGYDNENPGSSLKKDISSFRECSIDGSSSIPFDRKDTYLVLDNKMKSEYSETLARMQEFVTGFIDQNKYLLLVKRLLAVIELDDIPDDEEFYILDGTTPVSKGEMLSKKQFVIEPFLLGIVHYILGSERKNTPGIDTLNFWCPKEEGKERGLIKQEMNLDSYSEISVSRASIEVVNKKEFYQDEEENSDAESVEEDPDIVEEAADSHEGNQNSVTIIKQQTNVIQNGQQNINLTNNGNITFNF